MSKFVLLDTRFWAGGADLTGTSNKVEISTEVEAKETTNYLSAGFKEFIGGLASSEWKAGGFWEAGDPSMVDDESWADQGAVIPVTAVPSGGGAVGDVAYFTQALRSSYALLGDVGDVAPWQASLNGSWPTVRGLVGHPAGTARSATGTGTAQQLGAVATGKSLYATLHVLSAAGSTPSITGRVESDDNAGFTTPTTRLTFAAATTAGGQILRTDGTAITDDYWRIAWTISGITPSFLFAAALGIR